MTTKLLKFIQVLQGLKTGKKAVARVRFCWILGFGYILERDDSGVTESYIVPFTRVDIFSPASHLSQ